MVRNNHLVQSVEGHNAVCGRTQCSLWKDTVQSVEGHNAVCGRTQCSLWKDTMQSVEGHNAVSWPFKALVCPPLHMMSNTLCNHSETTDYTAMKTASRAATLETKQNLTPQPCCQLMCVNNYSKKRVTDPFDFRPPRTPVGSKPE